MNKWIISEAKKILLLFPFLFPYYIPFSIIFKKYLNNVLWYVKTLFYLPKDYRCKIC